MKIIYVMDPYDGWCYAGSENILRLYMRYRSLLQFEVLPAGMLRGELCCQHRPDNATAALRSLRAIEKETKAHFGEKHKQALQNQEFLMDSEVPCRAIMAVRQLAPEQTLPFTHALLHARFNHGMDLNDKATYLELCELLDMVVMVGYTSPEEHAHLFAVESASEHTHDFLGPLAASGIGLDVVFQMPLVGVCVQCFGGRQLQSSEGTALDVRLYLQNP